MAGVFLVACNFTDMWLLGLNSLRFSRFRVDRGWASLYSLSLMRPCDGTSGLVRGNRRKAVFAFKRLFSQRNLSRFPLQGARCCCVLRKCGEKIGNLRAQSDFRQQNRRSRKRKTGVWSVDLGFPRTSGTARRKYAANSGTHEHAALFAQRNRRSYKLSIGSLRERSLQFAQELVIPPLQFRRPPSPMFQVTE